LCYYCALPKLHANTHCYSGQKKAGQTEKKYVHMLNATLCATTRTLSCILENYQTPEGVTVPPALVPYMGGVTFVPYVKELPSDKQEAKGATKGGYAVGAAASAGVSATKKSTPAAGVPKAGGAAKAPAAVSADGPGSGIAAKIVATGDAIRDLKKAKADTAALQPHIDALLALKKEYKETTGSDYRPPAAAAAAPAAAAAAASTVKAAASAVGGALASAATAVGSAIVSNLGPKSDAPADGGPGSEIAAKIVSAGDAIRDLKKAKADKAALQPHIDALLALKKEYKEVTGKDYAAPGAAAAPAAAAANGGSKAKGGAAAAGGAGDSKKSDKKSDKKPAAAAGTAAAAAAPKAPPAVLTNGTVDYAVLNSHLLAHSFVGGWVASAVDAQVYDAVTAGGSAAATAAASAQPNVTRWLEHIASYTPSERAAWI
jgi:WHEP-TRS domain